MQHPYRIHLLSVFSTLSLSMGLLSMGIHGTTLASLTGQGSTLLASPDTTYQETLRPAAGEFVLVGYERSAAATQLVIGILLLVLGFFLRGLFEMRRERTVPVRAAPSRAQKRWFWVEVRL